jgi:alpha-ketoglutarate-dependent taurine dioxygenase
MVMSLEFETVKPHIGAIVHVPRDEIFSPDTARRCREMLEERTVLVFPRVNLTDAEQLAFTDLLGSRLNLTSDAVSSNAKQEDIYPITLDKKINRQPEYVLGTFFWHMDGITVPMPPPKATLLSARKLSAEGGQTEFCSTYAAYEYLPEAEKAQLEGKRAKHSVWSSLRQLQDAIPESDLEKRSIGFIHEHPIVWNHQSGRKSLVIGSSADTVNGMPLPHGRALLTRLTEWAGQPDFTYRHEWEEGDFVIWDNTGAMHRVIPYDADSGRRMHRTSIAGIEPVA